MVILITRKVSMKNVWRQCGEYYFYRDFMVKLVWRSSVVFMEKTR